jgi:serine/threonine-protein kinase
LIRPTGVGGERQVARFEREVQATAALTHPNTVEIYDYGRAEDGTFYYAMEYLPGLDLDELVERHGPLPPARVIHLLRQVCGALHEAHGVGLIHRDIKPANIIVCTRGGVHDVVKLLDFGLVSAIDPGAAAEKLTQDGAIAGTPEYMSAEQAEGVAQLDGRSDIYSLGAVAYYLLTGRPPFRKANALQLLFAHVREPVRPIAEIRPDVPSDLETVVLRCLEKDRERRFQDVAALDDALAGCQRGAAWTEAQAADWWHRHVPAGAPDRRDGET